MELKELVAKETSELEIYYPNGEASGMKVEVRDIDSPECKRVRKHADKVASRSRKGMTFEQKEEFSVALLCAATVNWTGYTDEGEEIPCTEEQKRLLYTDPRTKFVRQQIDEYLGDVGSFLSRTEKT